MKAAVRCNALTMAALRAQEKHGKRQDSSSKARQVNTLKPIVGRGLDLADLLAAHVQDTKKNAAAKNVALHFIVRFPTEILTDYAPTPYQGLAKEDRLRLMARQAAKFINQTHGGQAVFAVRVDRDEAGETIVDVFACPKYVKTTKKAETVWTSLTKFGKELAVKHQAEVLRRSKDYDGKNAITSPRAIGMSLQSEFAAFFKRENGQALTPKNDKDRPGRDRLNVEDWKLQRTQQDVRKAEESLGQAFVDADKFAKEVESEKIRLDADRAQMAADMVMSKTLLKRLTETYIAVRKSLPRIRSILTWDLAPDDEKKRARADRKEAIKITPFLRKTIKEAQEIITEQSPLTEKAVPESNIGFSI